MEIEKKNSKGIIVLIILLILIIFGLIGHICYDKFYTNTNNSNNNNNNNSNNYNSNETISIDSEVVTNAMKILKNIYISNDDLYSKNSYNISEISNYDLVATALKNIDKSYIVSVCDADNPKKTVSFEVLNSALNKYVLNQTITVNTIKALKNKPSYSTQYEVYDTGINIKEDGLELHGSCGKTFQADDYINKKVISAEKNNDYLYIYEKQAFAKYTDAGTVDSPAVNYYKDYNKTTLLEKNLDSIEFINQNDNNTNKNVTPKWELYNTYKYTLKKINNNYYFESFEITNK